MSLPPHTHKNTNVTQLVDTTINPTNQTSIFLFSFSLFFLCSPPLPRLTPLFFFFFRYPLPRRGSWVVETFFKLTKRYCSSAQPFGNPPRNQTKESIASFRTLSHLNLTGVVKRRVGNAELSALEWKSKKKGGGFVRGVVYYYFEKLVTLFFGRKKKLVTLFFGRKIFSVLSVLSVLSRKLILFFSLFLLLFPFLYF